MGSFDLRTISITVIIALIVGAGAGYMVGNSPVSSLMEEKDWLDAEYDSLSLAFQSLEVELEEAEFNIIGLNRTNLLLSERYAEMITIDQENRVLEQQVIDLEAENEYLNLSYEGIIETMDLFRVSNFSRRTELNLSAGPTKTYRYDIGYGIIWEVVVEFTGRTVGFAQSWIRGDKRGLVSGGGCSLTETPSNVNILIQLDIYDTGGDDITVSCDAECLEFPWISSSSGGRFAKIPPT